MKNVISLALAYKYQKEAFNLSCAAEMCLVFSSSGFVQIFLLKVLLGALPMTTR